MQTFRKGDTIRLSQTELLARGIDLRALGQTSTKDRPYIVMTSNSQMTWLIPLTTKLKGAHGRIEVRHRERNTTKNCEAITTDMFSIATQHLAEVGRKDGHVYREDIDGVAQQAAFSLMSGRLGVYPQG